MNTESKEMTVEEIRSVATKIAAIHQKMTYLLPRSAAERAERKRSGFGWKKLERLKIQVAAAKENAELLPPSFDVAALEKDEALSMSLAELAAITDGLAESVRDTLAAIAGPAMVVASTACVHLTVDEKTAKRLKPFKVSRKSRTVAAAPVPTIAAPELEAKVGLLPSGEAQQAA